MRISEKLNYYKFINFVYNYYLSNAQFDQMYKD